MDIITDRKFYENFSVLPLVGEWVQDKRGKVWKVIDKYEGKVKVENIKDRLRSI